MACCMFAAFIVGNILMMWRRVFAWWSPERAAASERAYVGAAAWRPGMEVAIAVSAPRKRHWMVRPVGAMLIVVSLSYFTVQAKDALEQTSDARSFAILLAQNICRVNPDATSVVAYQLPL